MDFARSRARDRFAPRPGSGTRIGALLLTTVMASFSLLGVDSASATGTTAYSNDFTTSIGNEWSSNAIILTTPSSAKVLGVAAQNVCFGGVCDWPGGSHTLTLSLSGLPEHSSMMLDFDFYTLRSWDGNDPTFGQDKWDLDATGVVSDIQPVTNFSNFNPSGDKTQSYPDAYPATNPGTTGAAATGNLLGYNTSGNGEISAARYDLNYVFDHSADDVTFTFSGTDLQGWADEGWVLDNVTVTVNPIEVTTESDDLTDNGNCTLREAIKAANTDTAVDECPAGSGADTISVPAGTYTLSIPGTGEDANATGDLDITDDLTIVGTGNPTIDANDIDRILEVKAGGTGIEVELIGLTLTDGSGAMRNEETLTLTESTVTGNTGGFESSGALSIVDSTMSNNTGGIAAVRNSGSLTVLNSTFTGNSTVDAGGAIVNAGASSMTMTNSTISGNTSSEGGGGIANFNATASISNSTITANVSPSAGGILNEPITGSDGEVTLSGSIIANNSNGDCGGSSPYTSTGHNLIETVSCTISGDTADDITGVDPSLGSLADNGGPTFTHALLGDSPAIDENPECPPPTADQRGIDRPQGPECDIGAFETTPPSSTITFPADDALYRAATFAAGCADGTPNVCGAASPNPDGAALDLVEVRIQRASDDMYWSGSVWQQVEAWNAASGTSSWTYGFTPGDDTYTLSSRSTDDDGYVESTATVMFTVDTMPPDTSIAMGPGGPTNDATPSFTFTSTEQGSTFECSVDAAVFTPCSSGDETSLLLDGAHTFYVRATDPAGNTDDTAASRQFTVDTIPPDTSIASGPSGTVYVRDASFTFTSEPNATFTCQLDDKAPKACTSSKNYSGLALGPHKFKVFATDAVGNEDPVPAERSWTIAAPQPKTVVLKASRGTVPKGERVRLSAIVSPCAGHEGDRIVFQKKVEDHWKRIARKDSNNLCKARTRPRIWKTTVFRAVSPKQDADHAKGVSNRIRIFLQR
jgi:CSLREA domain-containing protein